MKLRKETNLYDENAIEQGMLDKVESVLTDETMFNRLINKGTNKQVEGIFMDNGKVYINMTYLNTGTLKLGGTNDHDGLMEVYNSNNVLTGRWNKDGITIKSGSIILNEDDENTEFRVNPDGSLSVGSGKFTVSNLGAVNATNATITGRIIATSGTIGAANATNKITIGTNATNASIYSGMSSLNNTSSDGFYLGTDGLAMGKGNFKVTNAGVVTIKNGSITLGTTTNQKLVASSNGSLTIGTKFSVTNTGVVNATNAVLTGANVSGTITSEVGNQKIIINEALLRGYENDVLFGKLDLAAQYTDNGIHATLNSQGTLHLQGTKILFENAAGTQVIGSNGITFYVGGDSDFNTSYTCTVINGLLKIG